MNDRIKLAEAMGWERDEKWGAWVLHVSDKQRDICRNPDLLPDPFTDANDDYAVLEWAYAQGGAFAERFGAELKGIWKYKKGDYARAALKVIDD